MMATRINLGTLRLTLGNLKVNDRLSEETTCFSADMYLDGKYIGTAGNRGNGGCNDYHHPTREDRSAFEDYVQEWAKETGHNGIEPQDSLVAAAMDHAERLKIAQRNARKGFAFTVFGFKGLEDWGKSIGMKVWQDEWSVGVRAEEHVEAVVEKYQPDEYGVIGPDQHGVAPEASKARTN